MHMRLSIILSGLIYFTLNLSVSGQTTSKVVWGEAFETGKTRSVNGFVSDHEDEYYFLNSNTASIKSFSELTKLDSKMNLVTQEPFEFEDNGRSNNFQDATMVDDKLSCVYYNYKVDNGQLRRKFEGHLRRQYYNNSTLKMEGSSSPLADTNDVPIRFFYTKKNIEYGKMMTSDSRDFSKRVYAYAGKDFTEDQASFEITVINDHNDALYTAEVKTTHPTSLINRMAVAVYNDGTSYLLARIVGDIKRNESSELRVWKFNPDGSSGGEATISYPDKSISGVGMKIAPDGTVVCAGMFSYKGLYRAQGTLYIRINAENMSISQQKTEDFESSLIDQSSGSKRLNGYDYATFQGPYILDNGNTVIGIEKYDTNPLEYGDIVGFEFNKNGDITKTAIIRKMQLGSNDYENYMSYKLVSKGNKAYVVYNDKSKNTDKPGNEKHKKCYISGYNPLIIAELTANGFVKNVASQKSKESMRVSIEDIQQTQEGNLIFMRNQISGNNSKMQWGKMEL